MIQNCNEQILNDVIRVDLVPSDTCHFAVPFSVHLTEMTVAGLSQWTPQSQNHAVIGQALLSVVYDVQDGDDGLMDSAPKLSQDPKTTQSGPYVSHSLQVPLVAGFEATETAENLLHRRDFHVILTTDSGERYMIYSVPNSCEVLLSETEVRQGATLKITAQSASHVVLLTQGS